MTIFSLTGCGSDSDSSAPQPQVQVKPHSAISPISKTADWWWSLHRADKARLASGNTDILFLGNSIMNGWDFTALDIWNERFAPRGAVNLGIGSDRTQHLLWRIKDHDFSAVESKVAVVLIGTNNSNGNDNTAEQIADGIKLIANTLRWYLPDTKVVILSIFPRGAGPSVQRTKNQRASELASEIADGQNIIFRDMNHLFLNDDESIKTELMMEDLVHLNLQGYEAWADELDRLLDELIG